MLTDVVFIFEVHQPHRIRQGFFWGRQMLRRMNKKELFDYYFDQSLDREIFERACKKCYLPANMILLESIDKFRNDKKPAKFSFSVSGVFIEQCESYAPDVLELFKQLAETGYVEFLDQTYYHSVVSLYPSRDEFIEEVRLHRRMTKDLLGKEPSVFENTELLYNNAIAKEVESLGYDGIVTEGADRTLLGRSPNYVYRAKDAKKIRVLLRNFKLTDDIGFRFSQTSWSEHPLTSEKYASWIATSNDNCIIIFPDYETFGEHHWPETGIHDFLRKMPEEILKKENLSLSTPSEVLKRHKAVGELDVPETDGTISWADIERNTSGWIGNTMQWAYYTTTKELEPLVREANDEEFSKLWRNFLISDHLYYMYTAGGGPGEVHTYFSPYKTPLDAAVTVQSAVSDFESRLRLYVIAANEPFIFHSSKTEDYSAGEKAWSLKGFASKIKEVDTQSIRFHNASGDFENWASLSLRDNELARRFRDIRLAKIRGQRLRDTIHQAAAQRFIEINESTQISTQLF